MTSVDAKLLKSTKFPSEFNQKVDFQKVNLEVMKKYVQTSLEIPDQGNGKLTLLCNVDGSQERYQIYWELKMML